MMIDAPPAIHYEVAGQGEAVVLLNGGMMSSFAWQPIAQELEKSHRVVRLDFRGQLRSPGTPPPTLAGHAADVVGVLDALGIEKAHLVGTSFGALVALVLAADYPDRVSSLVAMTVTVRMSPEMDAGTRRLRGLAQETLAGGDGGKILDVVVPATYSPEWIAANEANLALRRVQVAALPRTWFSGLDGLLGALEEVDLTDRLAKIRAPTVVVAAEKDLTFPLPNSEELARGIAGARLVKVPGAPHGFVLEQPAAALAILRDALAAP